MTQIMAKLVAAWPELWRYPALAEALTVTPDRGDERLGLAVLAGIADPALDAAHALGDLVHAGEYGIVEDFLTARVVSDTEVSTLSAVLDVARDEALHDLDRRHYLLAERARRVDVEIADHGPFAKLLRRRRDDAVAGLVAWEESIRAAEERLAAGYEQRLLDAAGPASPAWAEMVRVCLAARDFPGAERLLADGPDDNHTGGPLSVPARRERFPLDRDVDEILAWYDLDAEVPPDFGSRWRPAPTDTAAFAVVWALREVRRGVDPASVRALAEALDNLVGAEGARHPVERCGGGFRTTLTGLHDPRLVRISPPATIPLWVGPARSVPANLPSPCIRYLTEGRPDPIAPFGDVADLTTVALLTILGHDVHGRPMTPTTRRVNLLRIIYRQLAPKHLLPDNAAIASSDRYELRDDLMWLLDLLGLPIEGVTVDTLRYDTGGYPAAVREALAIAAAQGDDDDTTDLPAWRRSPGAVSRLCDAVFHAVDADVESAAAYYAALWHGSKKPTKEIDEQEIIEQLELMAIVEEDRLETLLPTPAAALAQAADRGLLRRSSTGWAFRAPGLADLIGGDEVPERLRGIFGRLRERRREIVQQVHYRLKDELLVSTLHWLKNELYGLITTGEQARAAVSTQPDVHGLLDTLLQHALNLSDRCATVVGDTEMRALTSEPIDLDELLQDIRRKFEKENPSSITIRLSVPDTRLTVTASRMLLTMAVENVTANAVRAATRGGDAGEVMISLRPDPASADARPTHATIDIEDSGPGIDPAVAERLRTGEPVTTEPEGSGVGLLHARLHLEYSGGTLVPLGASDVLGGAAFRIRLPVID